MPPFLDKKKHLLGLFFCSRYKSKVQGRKSHSQHHLTVVVLLFWNNQVYTRWKPTPWSCSKNSYSVPVLKIIRKWNECGKENVYFKGFLATGSQYLYSRLFHNGNFFVQLLPTAWEYSMSLPPFRIKSHNIKSIDDEKCV